MRNIFRKAVCVCLALCLCLSLGACYSEENTWAAKHGDDTMPIGSYIYYLNSAYTDAGSHVSANDAILGASIDGKSAKEWMKDRALAYVGAYYFVRDKFDEMGLTLSEDDLSAIDTGASTYWTYYKEGMEAMGVSEDSFKKAYAEHNVRARLLMLAMYGEDGEMAVSEDDFWDYYEENYYSYEYMYVSKSKTDEENNSVALTDEELADMKDSLQEFAGQINDGSITLSEAYTEYSYVSMSTPSHEAPGASRKSMIHTNISSELPNMKDNEAKLVEVDQGIYLLQKLSLRDYFDTLMADADQKDDLLVEMKNAEFIEYAMEQGKALNGVEVNEKAIGRISVDSIAPSKDAKGTSVAPGTESGAESEASSQAEG